MALEYVRVVSLAQQRVAIELEILACRLQRPAHSAIDQDWLLLTHTLQALLLHSAHKRWPSAQAVYTCLSHPFIAVLHKRDTSVLYELDYYYTRLVSNGHYIPYLRRKKQPNIARL